MVNKIKIYKNFKILRKHRNAMILIGNFDGLHLGHQRLFKEAKKYKKKYNSKIGVVTFDPIPKMYFDKSITNYRLSNLNQKSRYFSDYKVDFLINKKFVCTNPDLIVDKGDIREFCAGSVAKIFEEIGGKVIYFGKPYPPVYNLSANINGKNVLCIGDNMNTDIKGANIQNFDNLLITSGIHKNELSSLNIGKLEKKYGVSVNYTQTKLKW